MITCVHGNDCKGLGEFSGNKKEAGHPALPLLMSFLSDH